MGNQTAVQIVVDAIITNVVWHRDGTASLVLDGSGATKLIVINPPRHLDSAIGVRIWGNGEWIYVNKTRWAERLSSRTIRLLGKRAR